MARSATDPTKRRAFPWVGRLVFAGLWLAGGWDRLEADSEPYLRSVGPAPLRFQALQKPNVRPAHLEHLWPMAPTNEPPRVPLKQPAFPETAPAPTQPHPFETTGSLTETNALAGTMLPPASSTLATNTAPVFQGIPYDPTQGGAITPQMILPYFFTRQGAGADSKTAIALPLNFTPPQPPTRPPSKATYQSP